MTGQRAAYPVWQTPPREQIQITMFMSVKDNSEQGQQKYVKGALGTIKEL